MEDDELCKKAYDELITKFSGLQDEYDLLALKLDFVKNVVELVKIKAKLEGDPIPSELNELIDEFFNLTTFRTTAGVTTMEATNGN